MPLMLEATQTGRVVDVLYGVPPGNTAIKRVIALNRSIQSSQPPELQHKVRAQINLLIDSEQHVDLLQEALAQTQSESPVGVFIKIDSGYHRAGISSSSKSFDAVLVKLGHDRGVSVQLRGFYTHLGHSYGFSSPEECLEGLLTEVDSLSEAAEKSQQYLPLTSERSSPYILSVGATPTSTAAQNLLSLADDAPIMQKWTAHLKRLQDLDCHLELHAGVYPLLDLQQLATGARPATKSTQAESLPGTLSFQNVGLRILVEVASVYTDRTKPEVLIAAGTLALGREPCKSYPGWSVVTPWRRAAIVEDAATAEGFYDPANHRQGWIVGRISQEHGILTWESDNVTNGQSTPARMFRVGDKLTLWPNHACVAAAGYQCYFVVDSNSPNGDTIRDVWVRWRGW